MVLMVIDVAIGACAVPESVDEPGATSGLEIGETGVGSSGTGLEDGGTDEVDETSGPRLDVGSPNGPGEDSAGDGGDDGKACVVQTLESYEEQGPVDIIVVVDTSPSMTDALLAVEDNINENFADLLEQAEIDYQVIVVGDYPPTENLHTICIRAPLSDTDCDPPPAVPAMNERYKHYDGYTGSGDLFENILSWYDEPTVHAPMGYRAWLRDGAFKVFLVMTDGTSATSNTAVGDAFDADLLGLAPEHFGTPDDRNYRLHAIIEMPPNRPASEPWLPPDPLAGEGGSIQHVARMTGGLRFPLSQTALFDAVFNEVASGVIDSATIACSIPIPDPGDGKTIDPDTIEIDVVSTDGETTASLFQVAGPQDCEPSAFFVAGGAIELCPAACAAVRADVGTQLDIRYGCDVGFDPQG